LRERGGCGWLLAAEFVSELAGGAFGFAAFGAFRHWRTSFLFRIRNEIGPQRREAECEPD
jgi:hypothetical protein